MDKNNNPRWIGFGLMLALMLNLGCQSSELESPKPMSEARTDELFAELPPLVEQKEDRQTFARGAENPPPPSAGEVVEGQFPPVESAGLPPDTEPKAPKLLRYSPQGEVERAELISLSFSEPMTELGSHAEQSYPDIQITPKPEGSWRWLDTRTLVFEPTAGRFPMTTEFKVEVDRSVSSAAGLSMNEGQQWLFATLPLVLEQLHPGSDQPSSRQPVLILVFNQPFDTQALLPFIVLTSEGKQTALREATEQEIQQDNNGAVDFIKQLETKHWLALRPEDQLPSAARAELVVKAKAPAAEGPRLTQKPQSKLFHLAGPLKIEQVQCNWNESICRPGDQWSVTLSNPLATDWTKELLAIDPPLPDAQVNQYSQHIHVTGGTKPETSYTLTLKAGTQDKFGQVLERDLSTKIKVDKHLPRISLPGRNMIVLPASSASELPVYTQNVSEFEVEIRRVEPKDWDGFQRYHSQRWRHGGEAPGDAEPKPGELVKRYTHKVSDSASGTGQHKIALTEALNEEGFGQLVVLISSKELDAIGRQRHYHFGSPMPLWIQVTNLGLSAQMDTDQILAWVTELNSGKPMADVEVELPGQSGFTNAQGMASLEVSDEKDNHLIVRRGGDSAFVELSHSSYLWEIQAWVDYRYPVFIFDDRGLYRPGEQVHLKGLVRQLTPGPKGDIQWPKNVSKGAWTLEDSQGNELGKGTQKIAENGSFDLQFNIPKTVSLGMANLIFAFPDGNDDEYEFYHQFEIQEFRRPEYQVSTQFSAENYLARTPLSATVSASYYAGGPLPQAQVEWQLRLDQDHYAPPGWDTYTFGKWQPYWFGHYFPNEQKWQASFEGTTNAKGEHQLEIVPNSELDLDALLYPHRLTAEASVTDVNRQSWESGSDLLVHPGQAYIGVRPASLFVTKGETIDLELVVVDLDGKAAPGLSANVTAEHLEWQDDDWRASAAQECEFSSTSKAPLCQFKTDEAGNYRITAQVKDSKGRLNQTQMEIWVAGAEPIPRDAAMEDQGISLIPDRETYAPGELARIQMEVPFAPSEVLVTIRRQGIVSYQRLQLTEASHLLEIPIEEPAVPTLRVNVEAVGASEEKSESEQGNQPVQAFGDLELPISITSRTLSVDLKLAADKLKPGQQASVEVAVKNHLGQAVDGGELTLYAVDESVLSLAGYQLPRPEERFYSYIDEGVVGYRLRDSVRLVAEEPGELMMEEIQLSAMKVSSPEASLRMADRADDGATSLRKNFSALATFEAAVALDSQGKARVEFDLPDNLTRYRVMAVVHREQQFGSGQTELEVGLPLMVRPSLPRFLNLGDQVQLPVVVQNTTDKPLIVTLALRASNLELTGEQRRQVQIPAGDRRELLFSARTVSAGTARIQMVAKSGALSDAAELTVPVLTPATTEAFAQYGSLTQGAIAYPVSVPDNVYSEFGGLELATSSTQFQSLTDAYTYLLDYPYGCAEQIASRLMSIAALGDLMAAFASDKLPSERSINASVEAILARLVELQNRDGGWGFWYRGETSQAYLSVHVTHALLRTEQAGFDVPGEMLARARDYLVNLESRLPEDFQPRERNAVLAYGLYVQALGDNPAPKAARRLFENAPENQLSIETLGWLLSVIKGDADSQTMKDEIRRRLNNSLRETAGTAQFVDDYPNNGYRLLHGSRRTDAVVLEALLLSQPEGDLVEKLARGLLDKRYKGHWGSTQENVFVLQALKTYFEQREAERPELTARAWLGNLYLGAHSFEGRTTERHLINVPMEHLQQEPEDSKLTLQHQGTGRLYYRLGLSYAPADLQLPAAAHGFAVQRSYEAVNDPADVRLREDGRWEIRAGAAVRVKLNLTAPARRHHLALVDFMPAGFEALNPELEGTVSFEDSRLEPREESARIWPGRWYNHQQMRDERVEVFATQTEAGQYQYEYLALATTPGKFIAPPAKAEEMYHPETFGRSSTDTVIIVSNP